MDKNLYKISVKDTGTGMSKEDVGKLFKAFSKVGSDTSKKSLNPQGIGLGLNLSADFVFTFFLKFTN